MDYAALAVRSPEAWRLASAIRVLTLDAVAAANSGHSGMPMGMADVATVLFDRHLRFDPKAPRWPDRDRFVLSAGHGSMLLYALLHLTGYDDMPIEELRNFRQWGSRTAGHPEYRHAEGIETTTGPLGQGLATAVGMAIAEEHLRAVWGDGLVDHRTWVIAGDGCLMEGVSQEAIALAGMQGLGRLVVLFDDNGITIDGKVEIADRTDQMARFAASGWHTVACDGHDPADIHRAIEEAKADPRPSLVACRTHIAFGSSALGTSKGHGALTDATLIADARKVYGWDHVPFEIPADIKARWERMGERGGTARAEWEARLASHPDRATFDRAQAGVRPDGLADAIRQAKEAAVDGKAVATRKSSEIALEAINAVMPETMGGSADLTGSNNTKAGPMSVFNPENRAGRYIHYGVREHGMAAAMNGLALHGGVAPYGGTFLCFADYARGALRLSALMGARVVYVFTHDSIGLGEDGPTHQPVEHLAMLRATPNLAVFRPADTIETIEAWEAALMRDGPSVLALSRQNLMPVRDHATARNLVSQGAYVLQEATGEQQVVLMATGSEVEIAVRAREHLEAEGIGTRVVSMPCWELFAAQDEATRRRVLGSGARVAVEAAVRMGWDRWLMGDGGSAERSAFVGMEGFGASAPDKVLYERFGITPEAVAEAARRLI